MSKEIMIEAHNWFYKERGFEWVSDKERTGKLEHWQVLTNKAGMFKGDCEDAALTVLNKMLELGVDIERVFIVRCNTENRRIGSDFNHAILGYVEEGVWYFSDNRYQDYPACNLRSLMGYGLYDCVSVDNLYGIGKPKLFK